MADGKVHALPVDRAGLDKVIEAVEKGEVDILGTYWIAHPMHPDPFVLSLDVHDRLMPVALKVSEYFEAMDKPIMSMYSRTNCELLRMFLSGTHNEEAFRGEPLIRVTCIAEDSRPGKTRVSIVPIPVEPKVALSSIENDGEPCPTGCCFGTIGHVAIEALYFTGLFDLPFPERLKPALEKVRASGVRLPDYEAVKKFYANQTS